MTIVRSKSPNRNFTIVSNDVITDSRLSLEARGLLMWLLSMPDNWQTNSELLSTQHDTGRDRIRRMLRELSEVGYMRLNKVRNESGWIMSQWQIYDSPTDPEPEKPETGKPGTGKPSAGSSGPINKTDLERTNKQRAGDSIPCEPEGFKTFWNEWPKSLRKGSKANCLSIWLRKKYEDQTKTILAHVSILKTSEDWTKDGGKFIPAPMTYLNQRRWDGNEGQEAPSKQWAGAI